MNHDHKDCNIEPETLSAWVDGELDAERTEEVRRHVSGCEACTAQVQRLRAVRDAVQTGTVPSAPASFVSDVRDQVDHEGGGTSARDAGSTLSTGPSRQDTEGTATAGTGRWMVTYSAAALILMGLVGGIVYLIGPGDDQRKATESDSSVVANSKATEDKKASTGPAAARQKDQGNRSPADGRSVKGPSSADKETGAPGGDAAGEAAEGGGGSASRSVEQSRGEQSAQAASGSFSAPKQQESRGRTDSAAGDVVRVRLRLRGERSALHRELRSAVALLDSSRVQYQRPGQTKKTRAETGGVDAASDDTPEAREGEKLRRGQGRAGRNRDGTPVRIRLPYREALVLLAELVRRNLRPHATGLDREGKPETLRALQRHILGLQRSWSRAYGRDANPAKKKQAKDPVGSGGTGEKQRREKATPSRSEELPRQLRTVVNQLRSVGSAPESESGWKQRAGTGVHRRLLLEWGYLLQKTRYANGKEAVSLSMEAASSADAGEENVKKEDLPAEAAGEKTETEADRSTLDVYLDLTTRTGALKRRGPKTWEVSPSSLKETQKKQPERDDTSDR